jgi:hypothetical protein
MPRTSLIAALTLVAGSAFAAPVPVTACGQVVTSRSAELTSDLDCSAFAGHAITMANGGRLELNGFTLTGDAGNVYDAVLCQGSCVVAAGIISGGDTGAHLVATTGRVRIDGATITNTDAAVVGRRVIVSNSMLTNNGVGVAAFDPPFSSAALRNSAITGSGTYGVYSVRIRLVNSAVMGSGGACPPMGICCDLVAMNSVSLRGASNCETSCGNDPGDPSFGVCAND